jgi:hypothetical protein
LLRPSGAYLNNNFNVNSTPTSTANPAVAIDARGNFVVAWDESGGILAKQYDATGTFVQYQITDLFNTVLDAQGNLLGDNVDDPNYELTADPSGLGDATVTDDGYPVPPWILNDTDSRWIGVADGDDSKADDGVFTYQTTFTLPSNTDLSTVAITGDWATDNAGLDIRINGISTGQTDSDEYRVLADFAIDSGFVTGVNTIEFDVRNHDEDNPTGLRVDNMEGSFDQLAVETTANGQQPDVAMDPEGNFVVVWHEGAINNGDVKARYFDSAGTNIGGRIDVNQEVLAGDQANASVATDSQGNFIVTWEGNGANDSAGVFAQVFDSNRQRVGGEFQVNEHAAGGQHSSSSVMQFTDNFVTVYSGEGPADDEGVYVRQFGIPNASPIARGEPENHSSTVQSFSTVGYWRLGEPNGSSVATDTTGTQNGTYQEVELGLPGTSSLHSSHSMMSPA